MPSWRRIASSRLQDCRVFELDEVRFQPAEGTARSFYRINAPDWINVIPLTRDDEVLFVRQYRFGVEQLTLEIPGGMCDPDETPEQAARRELREETGYRAEAWTELGWVHPNPALQNNRCHSFLARELVRVGPPQPDADEELELCPVALSAVPRMIASRRITHALVISAFHLLADRR